MSKPTANKKGQAIDRKSDSLSRVSIIKGYTREDLEQRAYELYLARGGADGLDLEDWLQAEREFQQQVHLLN